MEDVVINQKSDNRIQILLLSGIALASALIYWLVFTKPANFSLVVLRSKVYQDYLFVSPPSTRWMMIAAFVVLGILYGLGWYIARRLRGAAGWSVVLVGSLVFGVLLSYIYPIDASDLFNYIMYGRIRSAYIANPYVQVPDEYKTDEIFPLVSWSNIPSIYGPIWELMGGATARLAGENTLTNVLAFKWLCGLFMLAITGVIAYIQKLQGSEFPLAGELMFAWNPVMLYEVWGNGHNDVVMVFFILLAVATLLKKRHTLTILALMAGVLVKFIPILLIPAAVLISLRDQPDLRSRTRYLLTTAAAGLVLVFLAYRPFWEGIKVVTVFQQRRLFTTSLPAVIYRLLTPALGREGAGGIVSTTALVVTIVFAFWQAWRAYKNPSIYSFPQAAFNVMAFYLLVACLWFQQWYSVWLIGLAPVLASGAAQLFGILFGFLTLSKQFFMFPLLIWPNPRPPQPWNELMFASGVLGLPWLLAVVLLVRKKLGFRLN